VIRTIAYAVPVYLFAFASSSLAGDVVDFAAQLIGRPYVWGAEGPDTFDCSGLTQYVYQDIGILLPRRAIDQSQFGDAAGRRLQRGDLLFFSNDTRQSLVTHVGLYEGGGMMIDASKRHGRVRRDNLDDPFWAERFMFARRVSPGARGNRDRRADRTGTPPNRSSGRRAATIRVIERIAGELFKRPRN
jgi:cell wall-associated NlpC family hydrolase